MKLDISLIYDLFALLRIIGEQERHSFFPICTTNRELSSLQNHSAEQNSSRKCDAFGSVEYLTGERIVPRDSVGALPLPAVADVAHRSIHPAQQPPLVSQFPLN
jgi:hypothetical protein